MPALEHALPEEYFWNGVEDVIVNLENTNMILSDDILYSSLMRDFVVDFSFSGKMYLLNEELELV